MEHYVTLFDSLFLPQGLALHMSMERHVGNYTLWILCVDDKAHEVLLKLSLPNVRLLCLSELETKELISVKSTRSKGEYCWTLTPFAPRFVFDVDTSVSRVTYIDADLWFRRNPSNFFAELEQAGAGVLITDHAYAPEYDQSATSGQYCVQFMTFTRDGGEPVRSWWEARCLEWCFNRFEDGKFGDQKYLDDWPERFPSQVHVLQNQACALAPWNASRFPYSHAAIWHFHGLRVIATRSGYCANLGPYPLPKVVRDNIYLPYLKDLSHAISRIEQCGEIVQGQARYSLATRMYLLVEHLYRRIRSCGLMLRTTEKI